MNTNIREQATGTLCPSRITSERICHLFNNFNYRTPELLDDVYEENITFIDPFHRIQGIDALKKYMVSVYQNVESCHFDFGETIQTGDRITLEWIMLLRHPRLASGREIVLPGCSVLRIDNRVTYHRDYFDAGAMLYEHLPLLGYAVRSVKSRMGESQ